MHCRVVKRECNAMELKRAQGARFPWFMMHKGQGPALSSLATCDESMEDVWWKYGRVPQRYEDDSATMSKYGINPRARQFPNHRHPTTQHALYSVIPSPTSLFLYVRRTSSTQHMHHLTRANCYTPFLLNLPNPCYAYVSFLAKPQLPTIPSKYPLHSCCSMLCDTIAWTLHLSEVCPSPLSTWAHTLKRLVNACTPISGVIDSILVELQQDQQTCCKLNFIK